MFVEQWGLAVIVGAGIVSNAVSIIVADSTGWNAILLAVLLAISVDVS